MFDIRSSVDLVVGSVAHHAIWIAVVLFLMSVICWLRRNAFAKQNHRTELLSRPSLEGA
jgi:hypothetical protein